MSISSSSIRLFAVLALATPIMACSVFEGEQSVAEYFDDASITNNIRARYIEDRSVSFGDIGVTTTNGVVQLSGIVETPAERARAGQIARNTRGVRQVHNNITIR